MLEEIGSCAAILIAMFAIYAYSNMEASISFVFQLVLPFLISIALIVICKKLQVLSEKNMDKKASSLDKAYLPKIEYIGKDRTIS